MHKKKILIISLVFILFNIALTGCLSNNTSPIISFNDIQQNLDITFSDISMVLKSISDSIFYGKDMLQLPSFLEEDNNPCILFLSVSKGDSNAKVAVGKDYGFENALKDLRLAPPNPGGAIFFKKK